MAVRTAAEAKTAAYIMYDKSQSANVVRDTRFRSKLAVYLTGM